MVIETYSDDTGTLRWQGRAMYISPDGTGWSNMPYTKEQKKWDKEREKDMVFSQRICDFLLKKNRTLAEENLRITSGTSTLQKKLQKWFIEHYEEGVVGRGFGTTIIGNNID